MGRRFGLLAFVLSLAPAGASGQSLDAVELMPFAGYRFGGGFYELVSGRPVDLDGALSYGIVLDIPFQSATQIEAMVTHQEARFSVPASLDGSLTRWRVVVDHYQVGGLSEMGIGPVRPFFTGTLGLTRYATTGDSEVRFSIGAGGGVKLLPTPRVGVRLDGRVFATFVEFNGDALLCGGGLCIGSIDASVVWQAEFTAGLFVRF